jgi:hypothetical protein
MDRRWVLIILLVLLVGCVQQKPAQTTTTTTPGEYVYCDAAEPCEVGDCYLFPERSYPICYLGNPCNQCPEKSCRIAESYPLQVFCGIGEATAGETMVECVEPLQCDKLSLKIDRLVCFILKAKVEGNETFCEQITDPEYQNVCYLIIKAQKHGPSSCDSIPDMYWRHMCYEWLSAS